MAESAPLTVVAGAADRPLVIGDFEIPCYVLEGERRVLSQGGFLQAIGRARTLAKPEGVGPAVIWAAENLQPYIPPDLREVSETPIRFTPPDGGPVAYGYPAELLPKACEVYLKARDAGTLLSSQRHIAERADILMRGLATVGIVALIDEATGYQEIRARRAMARILEEFIAKELQPWTRTFPFEFYQEIFRLKGWPAPDGTKRPAVIGHYTNDLVYSRIAPGVLDELRRLNPVLPSGSRSSKHHQWFTPELAHPKLKEHLAGLIALMKSARSWDAFKRSVDRVYPRQNTTIPFALDD